MEALILFAKAPRKGFVKTRLLQNTPLTEDEVTSLYASFLEDVLNTVSRTRAEKIFIHYAPDDAGDEMKKMAETCIAPTRLTFAPQQGADFAEKIATSFRLAEQAGATSIVMTGSDSPTLTHAIINEAFERMREGAPAALGPSGEGGLYLIGLKAGARPDWADIFSHGAELANLARAVPGAAVLREVTDVDVAEDLVTLISLIEAMAAAGMSADNGYPQRTAETIRQLTLRIERSSGTRSKMVVKGDG